MSAASNAPLEVAIIGSGFGGLGMAYYLKRAGIDSLVVLERAADLGGTWRDNSYPGCGCDIPSHLYSFSFEPNFPFRWRYAKQDEIHGYLRHCATKYDLAPHIRYGAEVSEAAFDAGRGLWTIALTGGDTVEARFLVSAVGQLSRPSIPRIPGLDRFRGRTFHSANWDHGYDLAGKRVAVVGTGASAVQFVPEIAPTVAHLDLYQRSPGWVIPKVEKKLSRFEQGMFSKVPLLRWLDRGRIFLITEALAYAYRGHRWAEWLATAVARIVLLVQVRNPELRRKLTPDFPIGCKRILLSNAWLPTLARTNVEVVTSGIAEVTENGVKDSDGRVREVDAIIFGTGFTATEFLAPMKITGVDGKSLGARWVRGASAYLGLSVPSMPNFFVLYGPNTNLGSGSIIFMLEQQQKYVAQIVTARRKQGWTYASVRPEIADAFDHEMRERSAESTFAGNCRSWYKTADGRNTNNWVGSMWEFRKRVARPELADFNVVTLAR